MTAPPPALVCILLIAGRPKSGETIMSGFKNPYDPNVKLSAGCACGAHATPAEHDAAVEARSLECGSEALHARVVESAVMRALFPHDEMRRRFLRAVGSGTALSAISTFFPLGAAKEAFAQSGKLEKQSVKIGFIPITCATPIIMSLPMGFYARQGLNVDGVKTAGWAVIRDKNLNQEYEAAP